MGKYTFSVCFSRFVSDREIECFQFVNIAWKLCKSWGNFRRSGRITRRGNRAAPPPLRAHLPDAHMRNARPEAGPGCCNQIEMSPGLQSRSVTKGPDGSKA